MTRPKVPCPPFPTFAPTYLNQNPRRVRSEAIQTAGLRPYLSRIYTTNLDSHHRVNIPSKKKKKKKKKKVRAMAYGENITYAKKTTVESQFMGVVELRPKYSIEASLTGANVSH